MEKEPTDHSAIGSSLALAGEPRAPATCSRFEPAEVAALVGVFLCILTRIHEGIRRTDGESLRKGFSPPLSSLSFLVM